MCRPPKNVTFFHSELLLDNSSSQNQTFVRIMMKVVPVCHFYKHLFELSVSIKLNFRK